MPSSEDSHQGQDPQGHSTLRLRCLITPPVEVHPAHGVPAGCPSTCKYPMPLVMAFLVGWEPSVSNLATEKSGEAAKSSHEA